MSVPALRFSEFAGEWSNSRLDEVASVSRGKFSARPRNDPRYFGGDVPFVQTGDIVSAERKLVKFTQTLNYEGVKVSKIFPAGTILITIAANIGDVAITDISVACPDSLVGIITKKTTSTDFIYEYLATRKSELASYATQNAQANINLQVLNPLKVPSPPLPEQKKIAAFLGAVDARIAGARRRRDLLETYKRGLMQALFSRTLRFTRDDGTAFPDWEEKRLGDVAEFIGGGTPDSNDPSLWNGDVIWFTPSEIKSKHLTTSKRTITKAGLAQSSAKLLPIGALLLSTRATVGDVGIASRECTTNQGFQSLVMRGDHVNEFWYYWLLMNKKALLRRAAGSTFLEIGKTEIQKIPAFAPHPDEQRKIADALSAMDTKIDAVSAKITQLEAFKKGLLQQMFV